MIKPINRNVALIIVAVAAFVLCATADAWACPNCREALADDPRGLGLATGFYYSIIFMMSMPFIVMGTLVSVAYRTVQRSKGEQGEMPAAETER
jgi:p-aminobenzoyl-glutamate transporter AbgT